MIKYEIYLEHDIVIFFLSQREKWYRPAISYPAL